MCDSVHERIQRSSLIEMNGQYVVCTNCGEAMHHTLCRDRYVDGEFVDCHKWTCENEDCMVEYQFGGPQGDSSAVTEEYECVGPE